ncbi:MAG: undecaprenyl-phosphate glucose phosphotransferase [Ramlibacter sp.]
MQVPRLHQGDSRLLRMAHTLVDPVVATVSLWIVAWAVEGILTPEWLLVSVLAFALAFPGQAHPHGRRGGWAVRVVAGWLWVVLVLLLAGQVTGQLARLSPRVLLHWLWLAPALQLVAHAALRRSAPWLLRLQGAPLRAVVVGLNTQGQALASRLRHAAHTGITLVGCFDDRAAPRLPAEGAAPRLGCLADVAAFIKSQRVHLVYLSLPMASQPRIRALLEDLQDTTASVYFVPDLFVTDLIQGRADAVCGLPVISVCDTPFRGPAGLVKRASDLILASAILLLVSPLMAVLALAIKVTSPGPVIFRQRRYGLDGQEIIVYKFRSMTVVEDGTAIVQAQRDDPRITRLGAFMRRTSLDELPQFVNVLQGRMSVVGPRPHAVAHNELYRSQIRSYMVRHKVRPGITGWAQVHGLRGETQSLAQMQARVQMDLDYLRHWSLALDLAIIARTVRLVFRDSAAY